MKKYMVAPNEISCKDLDYLSDMFQWNYGALKNTCSSVNEVEDKEIKTLLKKGCLLFESNMKQILKILGGKNEQ